MKKLSLSLVALCVSIGSSYAASIKWAVGYDAAVNNAKSSHRLLMVDFYTDWCTWCKKLDKDTYEAPSIVSEADKFVPLKLNAEKDGIAQAKKYKVNAFPTILFLKPTGELVWKIEGYMPAEDFRKQMELAQGVTTELPKLEAEFKASGGNAAIDSKLAAYYGGQGATEKMQALIPALDKVASQGPSEDLGNAYNAVGDSFQSAQRLPEAIKYFRKAELAGKPAQVAYARISIATCYLSQNDPASATPVLEAVVKMGPDAGVYLQQAQSYLKQIGKKN